jgi:hypothetical protein
MTRFAATVINPATDDDRQPWPGAPTKGYTDAVAARRPLRYRGISKQRADQLAPLAARFWRVMASAAKYLLRRESHHS